MSAMYEPNAGWAFEVRKSFAGRSAAARLCHGRGPVAGWEVGVLISYFMVIFSFFVT